MKFVYNNVTLPGDNYVGEEFTNLLVSIILSGTIKI